MKFSNKVILVSGLFQNPHLRQVNCGFSIFAFLKIPLVIKLQQVVKVFSLSWIPFLFFITHFTDIFFEKFNSISELLCKFVMR